MIRRRGFEQSREESSSEEEEDAFSALSRKSAKRQKKVANTQQQPQPTVVAEPAQPEEDVTKIASSSLATNTPDGIPDPSDTVEGNAQRPILSLTSSMKRHHKPSDLRKAKMDALLEELEAEKKRAPSKPDRFVPEKKGSFVEPSEVHLTTNIFVGNLDPSIGEEELTDLFLQFGDLYSVKIMWPRTPAERSRNRNTGFVCFMNREDAEEAMDACNEADPFKVGRLLMMRWGKNVKKIVKRGHGTGGVKPILRKTRKSYGHDQDFNHDSRSKNIEEQPTRDIVDNLNIASTESGQPGGPPSVIEMRTGFQNIAIPDRYQEEVHHKVAFIVEVPPNKQRFNFISTVALFVSKDGSHLERRLIQREGQNPKFSFLTLGQNTTEIQRREHIFYRWRVYAFCQGDGFSLWRTEPFVMFHPYGRFWIPPAIDKEAALLEEINERNRQEMNERNRKERRRLMGKREYMTGRQMEHARDGRRKGSRRGGSKFDGGTKMGADELEQFNVLVEQKLSVSRKAICEAMAFCFEQSGSAKEIAELVREALIDSSATLDMRIARLYLLSDILFNSQQPGVKNAFLYRDAIEKMAPEIFSSLGRHGGGNLGRMTMNKLRTAVSSVLAAWTDWSVYNPAFLDELEARFEGREIKESKDDEEKEDSDEIVDDKRTEEPEFQENVILDRPRGDWKDVNEDEESCPDVESKGRKVTSGITDEDVDGLLVDDTDGVPLDANDVDGDNHDTSHEPDTIGVELNDVDGAPIEAEDVDGEALDDDSMFSDAPEKTDGKKIATDQTFQSHDSHVDKGHNFNYNAVQESVDTSSGATNILGVAIENGEDFDGEAIDGGDLDGEDHDCEDLDGEAIDGEAVNVGELDGEELDEDLDGEAIDGEELDA